MSRHIHWAAPAVFAAFVFGAAAHVLIDDDERKLKQGRELLASGKFEAAARALEGVEGEPAKSAVALEAGLLRAHALRRAGAPRDAAEAARELLEGLPEDHPARGRAGHLLAAAAEALGDEDEAARAWGAWAERVLGQGHRARVAGYYLDLASRFEKPEPSGDPVKPPRPADPARAATFRHTALKLLTDGKPLAKVTIPRARNLIDAGQAAVAASELTALLEQKDLPSATVLESRFVLARALAKSSQPARAREQLTRLLTSEDVDESPFAAPGRFLMGEVALAISATGSGLREAESAWRTFLSRHPDHERAPEARRRIASALFAAGEAKDAIPAFQAVAADGRAKDPARAEARFQVGMCHRMLSQFDEARDAFRRFLTSHPDDRRVPQAQALLPQLLLEKSTRRRESKDPAGAVAALRQYLEEFPLSARAPAVAVEIGLVLRGAKDFEGAAAAFASARTRYRSHDRHEAARAGLLLGIVAEEDRKRLEDAIKAYRSVVEDFGGTAAARAAATRIRTLERVELRIVSPRMFVPGEKVTVDFQARNVKKATVRVYKLDARQVFERRGSLAGVGEIETSLVKADRTFEYAVPDYMRYRRDEVPIAIELKDGVPLPEGAWLVAVQAEKRRSVALVLVSSVRVVVKESPFEVFCWAVDGKSGEPVPGVEILVRGTDVKATLNTGEDGTARLRHAEARGHCRVLAMRGDGVAPGLAEAPPAPGKVGLAPRVAFTLDRPIYRPGSTVRWQAVARAVTAGVFTTPEKGTKVEVWLQDARGRRVAEEEISVGSFGTLSGSFELPAEGAVGDWSLGLRFADNNFTETVTVAAYKKPEYEVTVAPRKPVVRPGEECDIGVDVAYFFGGPVREAAFDWRVWRAPQAIDRTRYLSHAWFLRAVEAGRGVRHQPGMTPVASGAGSLDANGHGAFTFRAPPEPTPQRYVIEVFVRDSTNVPVSGVGSCWSGSSDRFAVTMADRRTYRAGDSAAVRIVTRSLGHAAVATTGRARAFFERRGADGKRALEPRAEAAVDTGLDGEARVRLPLDRAGEWVIRFEGKDAHGAPVVDETRVVVTGDRPDLAKEAHLRMEKAAYEGGDTARMHLSVPEGNRPVLVTFEGERVLRHQILRPKKASDVHELVIDAALAPNVVVACAMPWKGKLLQSSDRIVVLRYLDVSVRPDQPTARPGDSMTVRIKATDQAGNPVRAAIAMSVIDRALQGLGGSDGQDPRFVFNRDVRPHLVVTSSSHAFRFDGRTALLDPDLLALEERERLEVATGRARDRANRMDTRMDSLTRGANAVVGGLTSPMQSPALQPMAPAPTKADPAADAKVRTLSVLGAGAKEHSESERRAGRRNFRAPADGSADDADFLSDRPAEEPVLKDRDVMFDKNANMEGMFESRFKQNAAVLGAVPRFAAVNDVIGVGGGAGGAYRGPGMVLPATRKTFLEVAAWKPDLLTDENGTASFTFELPDNLTSWEARASGTTQGVSVGRGSAGFDVKKDVILRIATPRFLTSRDRVTVPVTLHSNLESEQRFELSIAVKDGGSAGTLEGGSDRAATLEQHGRHSHGVDLTAKGAGIVTVEGKAVASGGGDAVEASVPIVAFGAPWRHVDVKDLVDHCDFAVNVPDGAVDGSKAYRVIVQTGIAADVLEGLEFLSGYPYSCVEQTVNRFLPALILASGLDKVGRPELIDQDRLRTRVRRGLARLLAFQNDDGGFGYWPGGGSSPWTTALVLRAIVHARDAGYAVPSALFAGASRGTAALLKHTGRDAEARAALVAALIATGVKRDADLNALFRERRSLGVRGLSRLALAADAAGRPGLARGVLRELRARRAKRGKPHRGRAHPVWPCSDLEANALALLAELSVGDGMADTSGLVESVRRGLRAREGGTKGVAVAVEALSSWVGKEAALAGRGEVVVSVDGKEVGRGEMGVDVPVMTLSLPELGAGEHQVRVSKSAGGTATCRLVMSHVRAADSVESGGNVIAVRRRVIAFQDPDRKADAFEPGYGVVKPESRPRPVDPPSIEQTTIGGKVTVELVVTAREDLAWIVVEDPQCASLEVIESGVRGDYDRFERRSSRMLFFKNRLAKGESFRVTYPCYAVHRGAFAILPATSHEMYAPERWGRSASGGLQVLPDARLLADVEPRVPTPDELWSRARDDWRKARYAECVTGITELRKFDLRDDVLDAALVLLVRAALRSENWSVAVMARDEVELRNPGKLSLSTDERLRLGRAHLAVNDPMSARGHFQSVVLDAFRIEMAVGDDLRAAGLAEDALLRDRETLLRYPALPDVVAKRLDIAARLLGMVDPSKKDDPIPTLHKARWGEAMNAWSSVMAWASGSSLAEEAGYRRVSLLAELGLADALIAEARRYLERHGKDVRRADSVTFRLTAALFAKGNYDEAKPLATELWEATWPRSARNGQKSSWRARAGYLLGRMAHVGGDYESAVTWYGRVREQVPDADQSWRFFTERILSVDPLRKAGSEASIEIPVKVKNVEWLQVQVYPVDLGVLFAVKKSFERLGSAEVSGLVPASSKKTATKLAKYVEGEVKIGLGKLDPGAYLVVMQDGDRSVQTLAIVSDASLTLQRGSGSVRVYLVDGTGKPIRGADVRMSRNSRIFHTGKTDERGMLDVRDPGRGIITVVAEKGDQVAVATQE